MSGPVDQRLCASQLSRVTVMMLPLCQPLQADRAPFPAPRRETGPAGVPTPPETECAHMHVCVPYVRSFLSAQEDAITISHLKFQNKKSGS